VKAELDVERALADLNKVVKRTGGSDFSITDDQIESIQRVVKDPRFDVYVGRDDGKIRRVSVDVEFDVPENQRARFNGLDGGRITIDVEFAEVGKPQRIEVPESPRPIAELTKQLGGLGALGAILGGGGTPQGGGSPAPGGGAPTPEQFQRYSECLEKAKPSDTRALEQCSALLQ
jgi:hypothetical protein